MEPKPVASLQVYRRVTQYWEYLRSRGKDPPYVSSTEIARALELGDVVVRKDLLLVSGGGGSGSGCGKPRLGYVAAELLPRLERFLGYDNHSDAVLVGAGRLGQALLYYENFKQYGFRIVAAFDHDTALIGTEMASVPVRDARELTEFIQRVSIHIGILTLPAANAQSAADALVMGGVRGIWNFAPTKLHVPEGIAVRYEDMAASLASLTAQIKQK